MIEQTVARVVYKGDGKTKEFPFSFPVLDRKFIYVVISDKDGRERTLTSDYYVDMDKHVVLYPGYPKGEEPAEAERPAVLAPGEKIVIYRNTPVSQLTSLGDKWPFDVCEKALDKLTMIDQENKESISRTVRLAGATEEVEVVLPPPEKDTAIGWSEDGKSVINVPVKRWQEEARAAAEKAQTQASMAMTYKEESKEARNKAAQSEEKAGEYANRAVAAETKVRGYATAAEEKHNAFVKSAETAKNEINALSEEVKAGITLTGGEQQNLIKGNATDAIESVKKQGTDETERVKAQGKTSVQDVQTEGETQKQKIQTSVAGAMLAAQKAQGDAETAAKQAEDAKNIALSHATESETYSQAALAAKEATTGAKEEAVQAKNDAVSAKDSALSYKNQAELQVSLSKTNAQTAKNWATSTSSPDGAVDTESGTGNTQSARTWALSARTEAGKAKTEAKNAQAEFAKAKTEADRSLTNSARADEAKTEAVAKAAEARTAADEAKQALKTAMGGVDLTQYAKKESLVGLASTEYVDGRFTHLIGASAESLDTLEEIGKSLKNDADFAGTMTKELAKKADKGIVENALLGKATKEELAKKADKTAVYTKTESDGRYQSKGDYVEKSTWDDTFVRFIYPGNHQPYININFKDVSFIKFNRPLLDYYDKQETDTRYQKKGDSYTKVESDSKYQAKGDYVTTGVANETYLGKNALEEIKNRLDTIEDIASTPTGSLVTYDLQEGVLGTIPEGTNVIKVSCIESPKDFVFCGMRTSDRELSFSLEQTNSGVLLKLSNKNTQIETVTAKINIMPHFKIEWSYEINKQTPDKFFN